MGRGAQLLQHIFQCGLTDEVACILLTQALHCRLLVAAVVPQKHQRLAGKAAYPGQKLDAVHVLQPAAQHQNVHIALLEPFQQRLTAAVARAADGRVALLEIACPYPHLSGVIAGQRYAPYDVLFLIAHTTRLPSCRRSACFACGYQQEITSCHSSGWTEFSYKNCSSRPHSSSGAGTHVRAVSARSSGAFVLLTVSSSPVPPSPENRQGYTPPDTVPASKISSPMGYPVSFCILSPHLSGPSTYAGQITLYYKV